MIMHRNRQDFFRAFLANDVLIENPFDLGGFRNIGRGRQILIVVAFLGDNVVAKVDAFIADIDCRTGDQLAHFVLALAAERANEISRSVSPCFAIEPPLR